MALDGLSLQVPAASLFGLLGPNGAGKSTVMKIVVGLVVADSGQVRWQDRPVGPEERRRFGYLPEERGLYAKMGVLDQIIYLGRLHGLTKADATASATRWLERLGVADRAADKVEALSLGNQQRVQLAAALVHDPEMLVLDEPFSGLDPVAVDALSEVLAERVKAGTTVIFSSHQLDLVEDICESVAIVNRGRLVLHGTVAELKRSSDRRALRVLVEGASAGDAWAAGLPGVKLTGTDERGTHLLLSPGTDPLEVLQQAARAGRVVDFSLDLPRLSELFRQAVGQ
ncbi:MAG: ATP-binding cassette domain-containing protein [Actinomycetota bacterium]|nr:ATP-binding cassette domain-containing protein [Actinomycetota bacterium]